MSEYEVKICPVCQQENAVDRTTCERCGSALDSFNTTIQVPEEPLHEEPPRARVTRRTASTTDAITLFILGHSHPIVINSRGRTILGRAATSGPVPTVDLSPYNAHLLGVSRHHAALVRTEEGYSLEDLGSTNGTWLNENRLFPNKPALLQNGDLFRLGQLMMVAYFSPVAAAPVEMVVYLHDALTDSAENLSPFYLLNSVTPYLEAVAKLQVTLDDLRGLEPADVGIQSIDLADNGRVKVVIKDAPDALQVIMGKVLPWRHKYLATNDEGADQAQPDHAETIDLSAEPGTTTPGYVPPESSTGRTSVLNPDRLSAPAVDFQRQLAAVIIQEYEAELPPGFDDTETYINRLLPLLTDLLTATLEPELEEITA